MFLRSEPSVKAAFFRARFGKHNAGWETGIAHGEHVNPVAGLGVLGEQTADGQRHVNHIRSNHQERLTHKEGNGGGWPRSRAGPGRKSGTSSFLPPSAADSAARIAGAADSAAAYTSIGGG